jgi:Mrp family chromosome partitioning ATPase
MLPVLEPGEEEEAEGAAEEPVDDDRRVFLASWLDKDGPLAEEYRRLRNSIQTELPSARIIVVTSCERGAGKTALAVNLAAGFAGSVEEKVLLIDANLVNPRMGDVLEAGSEGLMQVASGEVQPEAAAVKTAIPGLWAIPLGERSQRSEGILDSKAVSALLKALKRRFTRIIVEFPAWSDLDGPPAALKDADAVLVCVRERVTRRKDLARLTGALQSAGMSKLRCVFTSF